MMKENEKIVLPGEDAISILKEIELILVSLHKIGSYYMERDQADYEKETNRFIDEWKVTNRLAIVRKIITEKFDLSLGDDEMDDLEREMENLVCWHSPGDNPE